jgi:sulfur carrier protein ThiS
MDIKIRLYHGLNKYLPPGKDAYTRELEVSQGATVEQVLTDLGVPKDDAMVLLVGGRPVTWDHVLGQGDVLTALRPAGGG